MSTSLTAANAPKGTLEDIRICAKALHDATPAKTHDHLCAAAHDITGGSQEAFELWASYCDATGQNDAHAHRVWDNMHANSIRATIGIHALTGLIREVTGSATWTVAKARRMARDTDAVAEAATITVTVKLASGEVVEQVITWPRVNVTWRGASVITDAAENVHYFVTGVLGYALSYNAFTRTHLIATPNKAPVELADTAALSLWRQLNDAGCRSSKELFAPSSKHRHSRTNSIPLRNCWRSASGSGTGSHVSTRCSFGTLAQRIRRSPVLLPEPF